jgi:hypothetical protein
LEQFHQNYNTINNINRFGWDYAFNLAYIFSGIEKLVFIYGSCYDSTSRSKYLHRSHSSEKYLSCLKVFAAYAPVLLTPLSLPFLLTQRVLANLIDQPSLAWMLAKVLIVVVIAVVELLSVENIVNKKSLQLIDLKLSL